MRKWMISLLSVLALAFMFSGCGESGSAGTSANTTTGATPTDDTTTGGTTTGVTGATASSLVAAKDSIEQSVGVPVPANPGI
jgi:PBP1b-binding outer membrane lipoprotein LpoB